MKQKLEIRNQKSTQVGYINLTYIVHILFQTNKTGTECFVILSTFRFIFSCHVLTRKSRNVLLFY